MQLNETGTMAVQTSRMIRNVLGDRIDGLGIYDIVEEPNHRAFKIDYLVYDFAGVRFIYENDLFEIHLLLNLNKEKVISKPNSHYSEISDWDSYLKEIILEIESYIPEKYLKAKGWR